MACLDVLVRIGFFCLQAGCSMAGRLRWHKKQCTFEASGTGPKDNCNRVTWGARSHLHVHTWTKELQELRLCILSKRDLIKKAARV
jgi:hypothetical protein